MDAQTIKSSKGLARSSADGRRPGRVSARLAGRLVHALWVVCAGAACAALGGASALGVDPVDPTRLALWAAVFAPGLVGLIVAGPGMLRRDAARFLLIVSWSGPAFAVSAAAGGALSVAAPVFLAGPAALAASARRSEARLGAVMAGVGFAVFAVFSLLSDQPALASASAGPATALAVFLGASAFVAALRSTTGFDRLRRRLRADAPAAEAFRRAPQGLVALDGSGRILAVSDGFRALAPGAPHTLAGLPLSGFAVDEDDAERVRAGLDAPGGFVFDLRGPAGRPLRLEAEARPAGKGVVVSLEPQAAPPVPAAEIPPAPAEPALIERLRAERDEAVAADRAKSEFLASVSHELRTPLNAIIGFSDVMKQRLFGPLPSRYAEYADLIHESGRHLLDLIGDVLDMSKIEADRYELAYDEFDARSVIETASKLIRLRAEDRGLALICDLGDEALEVSADRRALQQMLLNLLSNAVKFTPEGGAVAVMARVVDGELLVAVGDSGVGMNPEELARVGKRYAQTSSARGTAERGSGLGLSLVSALAEMHGGAMHVDSRMGEGTTVTLRLPVAVRGEPEEELALEVHKRIRMAQSAGESIVDLAEARGQREAS